MVLHHTVSRWEWCDVGKPLTLLPWVDTRTRTRGRGSKLLHARYLHIINGPTRRQETGQFLLDPLHLALDPPFCDIGSRKGGSPIFGGEQGMESARYREPLRIECEFGSVFCVLRRDRYDLRSKLSSVKTSMINWPTSRNALFGTHLSRARNFVESNEIRPGDVGGSKS